MKKTVLGAAALLLAAACQPTEQEERSLNVSPTELSFTAVGAASQTVTVTANNVTWEYTVPAVSQEWLSVTQQGTTLTVSVSDNQLAEERIGQIRIDATDNSKLPARSVTVRQEANPEPPQVSLSVEPASLTFPAEGAAHQQVTVTAEPESMEWRAESDDDAQGWVTLTQEKGQLTVAVSDNPETRRRTGKVVVTPQHTAASPKAIVIVQEAKVLPPSLSADTEGPIAWEYDNDTGTVINIAAVNVQWSAKAVDDDGSTLPWLSVYQAEDYINAVPQRNTDSAPRSGFIVITADREEVAELRIPVSQGGAPDHLSTLTGDLDLMTLDFDHGYSTLMPYAPDDTMIPVSTWDINILTDGVTPSMGGIEGSGHRLHFMPVTERIEMNDDDMYILPDGEYEIVTPKPHPEDPDAIYYKDAWTIDKGTEGTTTWNKYVDFWYLEYRDNEVVGAAPVVSGTVTVTKMEGFENSYVFEFDLLDDIGNKLTGTYSGSIGLNVNGRQLPD